MTKVIFRICFLCCMSLFFNIKITAQIRLDVEGSAKIMGDLILDDTDNPTNTRILNLSRTPISNNNNSYGYKFSWRNDDGTPRQDALYFDQTGDIYTSSLTKIGIGTFNPEAKLHIQHNNSGSIPHIMVESSLSSNFTNIRYRTSGQSHFWDAAARTQTSGDNEYNIYHSHVGNILSVNAFVSTFFSSGRVGINDTAPSYTLELKGEGSAGKPGGGSWTNSSDKRLKKDIKNFKHGLELIQEVKPIFYHYNGKDDLPIEEEYVGVIAQELQKIAPFMVSEYEGNDGETYLSVDPSAFDFILVNAVKELKQEKDEEINQLKSEVEGLKLLVEKLLEADDKGNNHELQLQQKAQLGQNQPNPFGENTLIEYNIPENVQDAKIQITAINGKVLGVQKINKKGKGQLTIKAATYPAGNYLYTLILDGQVFETKRMVLTR